MVTINQIRTLGSVELRILLYMSLHKNEDISITQEDLARELNVSIRSTRESLKSLEERGIINYKRSFRTENKSVISLHKEVIH